jgi:hypothetical protein
MRLPRSPRHCSHRSYAPDVGTRIFRPHQSNLVTACDEEAPEMIGSAARFDGDYAGRQLQHMINERLPTHRSRNYGARRIQANDAARVLARSQTENHYRHRFAPSLHRQRHRTRCHNEGASHPMRSAPYLWLPDSSIPSYATSKNKTPLEQDGAMLWRLSRPQPGFY